MDITLINFMNEQLDLVDLGFKRYMYDKLRVSGNLVGISINLCKSIQKELFINDTP